MKTIQKKRMEQINKPATQVIKIRIKSKMKMKMKTIMKIRIKTIK